MVYKLSKLYVYCYISLFFDVICCSVLSKMWRGKSWSTSDRFPRVTLCDFPIRVMGNIQRYTVQCSLPLNLFNEKIYIFIWFWFVFVAIATVVSLVVWCILSLYLPQEVRYVKSRLVAMDAMDKGDTSKSVTKFVRHFLRRDGLLLVRLVGKNSSDLIAAELLCGLWKHYKTNKHKIMKINSIQDDSRSTGASNSFEIVHTNGGDRSPLVVGVGLDSPDKATRRSRLDRRRNSSGTSYTSAL